MGARTNYTIITSDNPLQNINVYAHWDGDRSVDIFKEAIAKAMPRFGDTSYFVRILINALQSDHDSETGYGIYVGEKITHEESYNYKEINLVNNTVKVDSLEFTIQDFIKNLPSSVLSAAGAS